MLEINRWWRTASITVLALAVSASLFAQGLAQPAPPVGIDLAGNWVSRDYTSGVTTADSRPVDFLGMPLSAAGRIGALGHAYDELSIPEKQCGFNGPTYLLFGPPPLKIWSIPEMRTGSTIAWVIGGWADIVPMRIWMDGRPHPSKYAIHTKEAFTTGLWEDDVLVTYTTHMEGGEFRNRMPASDLTTMTTRFSRHEDILTVTARIEDPVNFSEPLYLTKEFELVHMTNLNPAPWPCTVADEGVPEGVVPHYLPGKNPFVNEMTDLYGIPAEAVVGGAETMYPEYRNKIKDRYVRPQNCRASSPGCSRPSAAAKGN
jgi:hypothetical protein